MDSATIRPWPAMVLGMAILAGTGCAGWQQPKPDSEYLQGVNKLFDDRTQAALDTMQLLQTDPEKPVEAPIGTLTSDQAVQLTLEHNLSLVATVETLPIAQANLVQAGLWQNPGIGQSGAFYFPISAGTGPAT